MITVEGTIPFPPGTNAQAMTAMGASFAQLAQSLQTSGSQISQTAAQTQQTWTGTASNAMAASMAKKSASATGTAGVLASVQPIMNTFAAAITSAEAAYTSAVSAELAADAGMPWTAGALAAALAAEAAAVTALEVAGAACAAGLVGVITKLGLAELQQLGSELASMVSGAAHSTATAAGSAASNLVNNLVSSANSTTTIPGANGTTTVLHNLGTTLQQATLGTINSVETSLSALGLLTQPTLSTNSNLLTSQSNADGSPQSVQQALQNGGFSFNPTTPGQVGSNQGLLEEIQRGKGDESLVMAYSLADNGTSKTLTVQYGGIVSPADGSILTSEPTGSRNLGSAAVSQTSGLGQEDAALFNWIQQQNLKPGDTVNIYAHSQGGIVAQNLNDALSTQGLHVNVVTNGSPDQQQPAGSQVFWLQNPADPVVASKAFGGSAVGNTLSGNQNIITVNTPGVTSYNFATHDPTLYGTWADNHPGAPGVGNLDSFLQSQQPAAGATVTNGVVAFEGPTVPAPASGGTTGRYVVPK